jgi:hypothetical protein
MGQHLQFCHFMYNITRRDKLTDDAYCLCSSCHSVGSSQFKPKEVCQIFIELDNEILRTASDEIFQSIRHKPPNSCTTVSAIAIGLTSYQIRRS